METIKYEAVFGNQSLFDSAPEDAEAVFLSYGNDARPCFYRITPYHEYLICGEWRLVGSISSQTFSAMRRIIKTPVWMVADQKAGRLPEVGCLAEHVKSHYKVEILAIRNGYLVVLLCGSETQEPVVVPIDAFLQYYQPIETPEEKALRIENEWVDKAFGETAVFGGVTDGENGRLKTHLRRIYKAQLSGELPMPNKE